MTSKGLRPAQVAKPMFRTVFDGAADHAGRLLSYLQYLRSVDASADLDRHELGPSDLWKSWTADTFIGFSGDRVLFLSGHRFGWSELVPRPFRWPWQRKSDFSVEREMASFARCYPDFKIPAQHMALREYHPGAYLRSAEAYLLSGVLTGARMLEIGAGNCVHVAFRHLLRPKTRTVVIDLPASIPVGFLLLCLVGIDAALPNEEVDAAVKFRLPHQPVAEEFDFAFNMSSFQEMAPATVDGYLALVCQRLKPGGTLQHVNMRKARHIPGNAISNYDMAGLVQQRQIETPYHSAVAGFPVMNVIGIKPGDRTEFVGPETAQTAQ